jgi:hypothetical protein
MLMCVPSSSTAQFLARMVMPRSRSIVVVVHHACRRSSRAREGAALAKELVDERGLAMVDVGDDGDVAPA